MGRYILRRVLLIFPTLFGVILINFIGGLKPVKK